MFYHHGWGVFGFSWIFMVIFWVLIVWAIIALVGGARRGWGGWHDRRDQGKPTEEPPKRSALDILDERYAKGEIGKQEYEEKKKDILQK